jgi:hypothetical protein
MLRRFGFHGMSSLLFLLLVNSFSFATPSRVTKTKPAIQQSWQSDISTLKDRELAQLVERHPYKVDVAGSNPVLPTNLTKGKYLK